MATADSIAELMEAVIDAELELGQEVAEKQKALDAAIGRLGTALRARGLVDSEYRLEPSEKPEAEAPDG